MDFKSQAALCSSKTTVWKQDSFLPGGQGIQTLLLHATDEPKFNPGELSVGRPVTHSYLASDMDLACSVVA